MEDSYSQLTADSLDGSPAVILYRKAQLHMRDYPSAASSRMDVQVRTKILTPDGVEFGNVEIEHSRWMRLRDFEGRTVTPDGRVVPLDPESVFVERTSKSFKSFVTKAAFPGVEPGSIIDYRFSFYWDSLFYLEPWYFQSELPTVLAEAVFIIPTQYAVQPWGVQTTTRQMQNAVDKSPLGRELKVWIENAPKLPDEPYSLADEALSSRFMVVPKSIILSGQTVFLMDRWESVAELFDDEIYKDFRRKDRAAKKKAKELIAVAGNDRRARAEAIYRWVRDEVTTFIGWGVWPSDDNVGGVMESGEATTVETALLLQLMLDEAGIEGDLVWAAHHDRGLVDLEVANPSWFDGAMVRIDLGDGPIFLDASDPGLAFGKLSPGFEGAPAVIPHRRNPETLELPSRSSEETHRVARMDLKIDEDGKLSGSGRLEMHGQYAWALIGPSDDMEAKADAWKEALEKDFPTQRVSEVAVSQDADASLVTVSWKMEQLEDEVLGDEVSLQPAVVFASDQPFESETRLTPVRFQQERDGRIEVNLTWPEGWEIEAVPEQLEIANVVGSYRLDVVWDLEARTMKVDRAFRRDKGTWRGPESYKALRLLYDVASRGDASQIGLFAP